MSDLHQDQLSHIAEIVGTYSADPDDPTSLEVLLVLQEICHILEIPHYEMVSIFGKRTLHTLRTWGKPTAATPGPIGPRRVWIWWPTAPRPVLCRIDDNDAPWQEAITTRGPEAWLLKQLYVERRYGRRHKRYSLKKKMPGRLS